MSPTSSFADLMTRLEKRDQEAARVVYHHFARKLIGAVQAQLSQKYQAKIDPESAVQSAWRSFFAHRAEGDYAALKNWEELWRLLLTMARHKLMDRIDRCRAARRDVEREVSLNAVRAQEGDGAEPVDPNPTPAEVALLADQVEGLLQSFEKGSGQWGPQNRAILALHLQGYSPPEISETLGCAQRTVERVVKKARQRLERMLSQDDQPKDP